MGGLDAKTHSEPATLSHNWTVWRIDDNANTFVVRDGLSREEAERLVEEFTSHGHKQTYSAEQEK